MATATPKTPVSSKSTTGAAVKKTAVATKATPKTTTATAAKKTVAKAPAVKVAVPKAVAAEAKPTKAPAVKKASAKKKEISVSPEHRYHMIATAAYYRAEHRGFAGGYEMQDWISAEAEIDAHLKS